jgi:hypothetical protein
MRSLFALLVAAAVLFTPGWHADGSSGSTRRSELAAIVLAPISEKGVVRESSSELRQQLGTRQINGRLDVISFAIVSFGLTSVAFVLMHIVFSVPLALVRFFRLRTRFSRGPPLLQAA